MGQCQLCQTEVTVADLPKTSIFYYAEGTSIPKQINNFKEEHERLVCTSKTLRLKSDLYFKGVLDSNNKPTGYGQLQSEDAVFYGFFQNGVPHGKGVFLTRDFVYFGNFSNGRQDGDGKEHNQNGLTFTGVYENGRRKKGSLKTKVYSYEGQLIDDLFHGCGTYLERDLKYVGQFAFGAMNGLGRKELGNIKYSGRFLNGEYQGYGELIIDENNKYYGEFEKGHRHGFGRQILNNIEYSGSWAMDHRQGKGMIIDVITREASFGDWHRDQLVRQV